MRTWWMYGLYVLAATAFFLYYLFPEKRIEAFLAAKAAQINPQLHLSSEHLQPMLPPGLRLYNLRLMFGEAILMIAERASIKPEVLTLLGAERVVDFQLHAYEGTVNGSLTRTVANDGIKLTASMAGIQLAGIPLVQDLAGEDLSGVLAGRIALNYAAGETESGVLKADLEIGKAAIALKEPFLNVKRLVFEKVTVDAVLRGRQLEISRIALAGDQISGSLSGFASIRPAVRASTVNLIGKVIPQPSLLQTIGAGTPQTLASGLSAGGGIPVRVSGTFEDLKLSMN